MKRLRARQKLGKYKIVRRLGEGGFAHVYEAMDTIEGIRVALKIPHGPMDPEALKDFQREVRITARLDHPNILPIKTADFIDGVFVIVTTLGQRTLTQRLTKRISLRHALDYSEQLLDALAFAHGHRVIHCDVKPDNILIFEDDWLRLMDFGIARIHLRTMMSASGRGTLGYLAPEQAMGRPTFRSDCFSVGLIMYRMLTGRMPKWPYEWPPPGYNVLRKKVSPQLIAFLKKSMALNEYERFRDAGVMLAALQKIRTRELARQSRRRSKPRRKAAPDWTTLRKREFKKRFAKSFEATQSCGRCKGSIAESMLACPWCAASRKVHRGETRFPKRCSRCKRGMKLDWRFCGWCYGAAQGPDSTRSYSDSRYTARCTQCKGDHLPFMRYCPWCNAKVRRPWKVDGVKEKCASCRGPVLTDYWKQCPWCTKSLRGKRRVR